MVAKLMTWISANPGTAAVSFALIGEIVRPGSYIRSTVNRIRGA